MPKPTFFNLPPAKRERIIEAAVHTFGQSAYAVASLDDVVARADISKGSLYQYFDGKADLYGWLLIDYMGQRKVAAIDAEAPPPGSSVWTVLEFAVLSGVRFAAAEPALVRMGARFHRDQSLAPALAAIASRSKTAGRQWVREQLQRGVEAGEIRRDVHLDTAAGFVAYALGEGLLEQLAHTAGCTLDALFDDPDRLDAIPEAQLLVPVRNLLSLLRGGLDSQGGSA